MKYNLNYEIKNEFFESFSDSVPGAKPGEALTVKKVLLKAAYQEGFNKENKDGEDAFALWYKIANCADGIVDLSREEATTAIKCAKKSFVAGVVGQIDLLLEGRIGAPVVQE